MLHTKKMITTILAAGCIVISSTAFAHQDITFHVDVKDGPMYVSQTQIQLHVGESVKIIKDSSSADAGLMRLMGSGPDAFNSVNIQGIGHDLGKGSFREGFVITGTKIGTAYLKLVPDYGDWNHAVTLNINVIK